MANYRPRGPDASYYEGGESGHGTELDFDDIDAEVGDDSGEFNTAWTWEDEVANMEDEDDEDAEFGPLGDESADQALDPESVKSTFFAELKKLEAKGLVDIGNLASWEVSSFKQGSGKERFRDDDPDTYWQSDGTQPHTISIHFAKRVSIATIAMFTNYPLDESYTPSEILIRAGTGEHDLQDIVTVSLVEPSGWSYLGFPAVLRAFLVKIIVKSNHQNGKDTHIRSLKVFQAPAAKRPQASGGPDAGFEFKTVKMLSESCIR